MIILTWFAYLITIAALNVQYLVVPFIILCYLIWHWPTKDEIIVMYNKLNQEGTE